MATKPVTLPQAWGVGPNWTTGPFIGSPVKSDPGVGIAADGHRPGSNFPTAAEHENFQQFQVTKWVRDWLFAGSSLGLPDAHIVETNATGRATLHGLDVDNNNDEEKEEEEEVEEEEEEVEDGSDVANHNNAVNGPATQSAVAALLNLGEKSTQHTRSHY